MSAVMSNYIYMSKETFITRAKSVHGNLYDYIIDEYIDDKTHINVECKLHGVFMVTPNNHIYNKSGCPRCGSESSASKTRLDYNGIIVKVRNAHGDKFDYDLSSYKNMKTKIPITCKLHDNTFNMGIYDHIKGKAGGCPECKRDNLSNQGMKCRSNKDQFILNAIKVYGESYTYEKVNYETNKDDIIVTCPQHGDFNTTPNTFLNGYHHCTKCMEDYQIIRHKGNHANYISQFDNMMPLVNDYYNVKELANYECKKHGRFEAIPELVRSRSNPCISCCRIKGSSQELKLYEYITNELDIEVHQHHKVDGVEVDLYIPSHSLAIEVNGVYWHQERNDRYGSSYHISKTNICKRHDVTLLHFYDFEIDNKFDIIKSMISSRLGLNKRIYARNTIVRLVDKTDKRKFINKTHLQGNDSAQHAIGLYYNEELVSLATFGNRNITGNTEHELLRFSSKLNYTIVGGFTKLLSSYIKMFNPPEIKTYASIRYSNGNLYNNVFDFIRQSKPSYWYFHKTDTSKLYHRSNFMKRVLKSKLEDYDSELSERENMANNGYGRIWDCGTMVYKLNLEDNK